MLLRPGSVVGHIGPVLLHVRRVAGVEDVRLESAERRDADTSLVRTGTTLPEFEHAARDRPERANVREPHMPGTGPQAPVHQPGADEPLVDRGASRPPVLRVCRVAHIDAVVRAIVLELRQLIRERRAELGPGARIAPVDHGPCAVGEERHATPGARLRRGRRAEALCVSGQRAQQKDEQHDARAGQWLPHHDLPFGWHE